MRFENKAQIKDNLRIEELERASTAPPSPRSSGSCGTWPTANRSQLAGAQGLVGELQRKVSMSRTFLT